MRLKLRLRFKAAYIKTGDGEVGDCWLGGMMRRCRNKIIDHALNTVDCILGMIFELSQLITITRIEMLGNMGIEHRG